MVPECAERVNAHCVMERKRLRCPMNSNTWTPENITGMIIAIGGLVTAIGALIHSKNTRKGIAQDDINKAETESK